MKKMNAAIIGCGDIAGFYDKPDSKKILTHAHAFLDSKKTKLTACCDINKENLKKFTSIWGDDIHPYNSIEKMLKNEKIDIIVIASNTDSHYKNLSTILQNTNIKHIICEKPFVSTLKEYEKITQLLEEKKVNLLINYIRCFDPSIFKIKKLLQKNKLGEVLYFQAQVNKGLYHNGSHLLSLVEHLFGEIVDFEATKKDIIDDDIYGTFFIQTQTVDGTLVNHHDLEFALFEMELVCQNGVVKISDSGFDIRAYKTDKNKILRLYKKYPNTLQYYAKNSLEFLLSKNSPKQVQKHLNISYKLLKIKNNLLQGE